MPAVDPTLPANRALGMFAKYWDVGTVKTRLGRDLGMAAAAELHRCFVSHLTDRLATVAATRYLFVSPDRSCQDFACFATAGWLVKPQGSGGLGERMPRFFRHCFQQSSHVILIGSDCPLLSPAQIATAFDQLSRHDAVLGPAADGGYYLLGLQGGWQSWMSRLFADIPWSGERVAEVTRQRLRQAAASWSELSCEEDVDTIDCLRRLDRRLCERPQDRDLAAAVRRAWQDVSAMSAVEQGSSATAVRRSPSGDAC